MKLVDQGGFPHSTLSSKEHHQGENLLSNSLREREKSGEGIKNQTCRDKFQGCSQSNGHLRDVALPTARSSGRPALKFGILDPISLSVIGAAGVLAGGVGGFKIRKIFKNKAALNQQVKDLNVYLENLGAHHQVTAKNIFSVDTVEQILAHTNSEAKAEEVIPWLNLIQANLADDKQPLLTQVYLNRGIRHASPELRYNFVTTLTSEKTPRKLYQPLLIQFEKEENPQVAQALEKALFPMVAAEDVTELKASLAINSAPESFRHFCINVMAQKKFFNAETMALFLELLTKETNPNILKTVRETITNFSGQGDPESLTKLFKNNLKSTNLEVKRTAIAYLGGLKDPQLFPLLWESFLHDANGEIKPNIAEEYFKAIRQTAKDSHLPLVLKVLDSSQAEVLKMTFRLLKSNENPETTPALIGRLNAFQDLSQELYQEMESLLLDGIKSESKSQRDELLKVMGHPSSRIRKTVIQAFAKFSDPQLLEPWFKQMEAEMDPSCLASWKNTLKNISLQDPVTAEHCSQVLLNTPENSEVRKLVTEIYQEHKERSIHFFKKVLEDLNSNTGKSTAPTTESPSLNRFPKWQKEIEEFVIESLQGFFITPHLTSSKTSVSYGSHFIKNSIFPSLQFLQAGAAFQSPKVREATFRITKMMANTGDVRSEKLFALMADYIMAHPNAIDSNTETQLFKTCNFSSPDRELILEKNKALMNSSHEGLRAMGINIFISMASPAEIPVLIDFLKAESKPEFQATLISRLQKITKDNAEDSVKQLAALMKTETHPNIIESVVSLLKDTSGSLNVLGDIFLRVSSGEYSPSLKETALNGLMYRINKVKDNFKNNLEPETRDRFILLLKEEDPNLQLEILKIFSKDKSPVLIPALMQYLESPDKIHQELCTEVFLNVTPGEESRKLLQSKMSSSPDSHIRDLAARSFHKISTHPDIAFWVKLAAEEKDAKVKETLIEHLSGFKIDGAFYDQISPIFLSTPSPQVQEVLLPFISQFGFQGFKNILIAHQALEKKLLGKVPGGKNQKLGTKNPDSVSSPSLGTSEGDSEGSLAESSSSRQDISQRVVSQCQSTLLKMSQKLQEEHFNKKSVTSDDIPPLLHALTLPSMHLKQNVLNILKQAKSTDLAKRPMSEYFDALEKNTFPQLNELYSELITKAANTSHHDYLLEKLNGSPSKVVQVIAVKALKNSETPLAFSTLFKVLEENNDSVFTQSVMDSVKAHSKEPEAFPVIVDKLMGSGDPKIQVMCAQALSEHHRKSALPPFVQYYQTRYPALSELDKKSVDKAFIGVLENIKPSNSAATDSRQSDLLQNLMKLLSLETAQEVYAKNLSAISAVINSDKELVTPVFVSNIFDFVAQHYAQGRTLDSPSLTIMSGILQNSFERSVSDKTSPSSNLSKKFYQTLLSQFNSPEPTVRILAAQSLSQFIKQITLKEYLKLMDSEKTPEVIESFAKSLEQHPAVKSDESFTPLSQVFLSPKTSIFLSQKLFKILKGKFEGDLKFRFLVIDKLNQVLQGKVESFDLEDPIAQQQFQVFQTTLTTCLKSLLSFSYDATLYQKDSEKRPHSTVEALLKLPSEEFNKIALAHLSRLDLVNSEAEYTTAVSGLFDYLDDSSCLLPQQGIGALNELSKSNNSKFKAILGRLAMEKILTPKSSMLSRLAAVKSLESSFSGEDLPFLFRVLEGNQDQPLQEAVVKIIEKLGRKPEAFSYLTLMLRDSVSNQSKMACAKALEGHGDEALSYLYPALAQLSEEATHLPLVQSLEKSIAQNTMTEAAAPVLLENLKSPHVASKRIALLTTGTLIEKWKQRGDYSNQGIVGFLTKLKESGDKTLQPQAEKALNEMIERKIAELEKIVSGTKLSFEQHQAITQLCENAPSQRVKDAANNATGRMMAQLLD